ncbi:hypothetical protein [Oleidesulfovibrio sp.]|uniref:hypothetical protein n=1 Tax=Oleidesulfovibrio sp. TaxID=2909707 RepID=UPI003A88CB2A
MQYQQKNFPKQPLRLYEAFPAREQYSEKVQGAGSLQLHWRISHYTIQQDPWISFGFSPAWVHQAAGTNPLTEYPSALPQIPIQAAIFIIKMYPDRKTSGVAKRWKHSHQKQYNKNTHIFTIA